MSKLRSAEDGDFAVALHDLPGIEVDADAHYGGA